MEKELGMSRCMKTQTRKNRKNITVPVSFLKYRTYRTGQGVVDIFGYKQGLCPELHHVVLEHSVSRGGESRDALIRGYCLRCVRYTGA